jgi:hypothetical protein
MARRADPLADEDASRPPEDSGERPMTSVAVSQAARVEELAAQLRVHTAQTRLPTARRIDALCAAARVLQDGTDPLTRALNADLERSSGLTPPMIDWALRTTLSSVQPAVLHPLAVAARASTFTVRVSAHLVAVILAGNVFTSALRALFLPLLCDAPVLAKTASCDSAFARALKHALDRVDPALGARLELVSFSRDDASATQALLSTADVVSAYGDDATLHAIERALPSRTRLIPHGHGISAAYISAEHLTDRRRARDAADRIALDIAAYDQRGCLSPHAILVQTGARISPEAFAELLAQESLPLLAELLPPGAASPAEHAAALQWRAVAAVRGKLIRASGTADRDRSLGAHERTDRDRRLDCAVSLEPAPLRPSPGGRQIGIYPCLSPAALPELLSPFARHLKCLGASDPKQPSLRQAAGSAHVCRIGTMQTPAFDVDADGVGPLAGLFRFDDPH